MRFFKTSAAIAAATASLSSAISVDLSSSSSIKDAASTLAFNMVQQYYVGNESGQIPGIVNGYYWWEAGAMFGTLIDYWYYTGDTAYNDITTQALIFQASPTLDYMPQNQTEDEGNDDQMFWGFAAMTAAEYNFPNPPSTEPQWLALAQGVFNSQAYRWDNPASCNGGLNWQIFTWNNGFSYKNAPANGGFLNLGSRLYAYTANETYAEWVNRAWDWMYGVGLIAEDWSVFDGTDSTENCTSLNHVQWTYSFGMLINAACVMWNVTQDPIWETRARGMWGMSVDIFFKNEIMYESACEPEGNCDQDQVSFKAYFSRFLAASTKWAPWFADVVAPYLSASATAAAAQCTGGTNGETCGFKWTQGFDGNVGLGQQLDAIEVILSNLISESNSPLSAKTGGTSIGNASTGGSDLTTDEVAPLAAITTADRAGAGILTVLVLVSTLAGAWWVIA